MKLTILGVSGKTGRELSRQALAAGHTVTGIVRRPDSLEAAPGPDLLVGDVTDTAVIARASQGSDVIISALGATSSSSTLMSDVVNAVIAASDTTGCRRFILMSSFAVQTYRLKGMVKMTGRLMRGVIDDKAKSEKMLRASGLDWTVVHAARLSNQQKGSGVRVLSPAHKISLRNKIARADVAAFILDIADKNTHVREEVTIAQ